MTNIFGSVLQREGRAITGTAEEAVRDLQTNRECLGLHEPDSSMPGHYKPEQIYLREEKSITGGPGMLQGIRKMNLAPQHRQGPTLYSRVQMSSRWSDYYTRLLLGITYLTEREKSPGALSLSLMRKAPSCLCLPNISSAFARGIFPKNHLCSEEKKTIGKVKSLDPSVEKPDVDIPTEIK